MIRTTASAVAGVAALALLTAPPATAGTPGGGYTPSLTVEYSCEEAPYGSADTFFVITFTTPGQYRRGALITVQASVQTTTPAPEDLAPNTLVGEIEVVAGGAGTGTVEATGLTNPVVPPPGDPLTLTGGRARFVADTPGVWTFRPGVFETLNELGQHLVCTPKSTPGAAARTYVGY